MYIQDGKVQRAAIFAYAKLSGYEGIEYLKTIRTIGEELKKEKISSIKWLKEETDPTNKYGTEIENNIDFINSFWKLKSPIMVWLDKEGFLDEVKAQNPVPLSKEKKMKYLISLLNQKDSALKR